MIHAQVDVELRDHERITGADLSDVPPEWRATVRRSMLGLFTWCLLYGQAKRLEEGLIPRATVHGALGEDESTARRLVAAGLLEERTTHYRIRNYQKKNRTGSQIEASIAAKRSAAAERQARFRGKQNAPPDDVSPHVTHASRSDGERDAGSGSDSGSVDLDQVSESKAGGDANAGPATATTAPTPPATSHPALFVVGPPKVPIPDELPPKALEQLEGDAMAGGWPSPRDEWPACRDYYRGKGELRADWVPVLRAWLRNAKRYGPPARGGPQVQPARERAWTPAPERDLADAL